MKNLVALVFFFPLLVGCDLRGEEESPPVEVYDEATYELEKYSIASLISEDLQYLNTPPKLNKWSVVTANNSWTQIELSLKPSIVDDPYNKDVVWALIFTTTPDVLGSVSYNDLGINLFYKYTSNTHCCSPNPPYIPFGEASESYIAVSGYIDFESLFEAQFSVDFQKETYVGSGITEGEIVNVRGCWRIDHNEKGINGCQAY